MNNNIKRNKILESFLENIACISDEDYQERVWVRAQGPECNDIDDAVCDFFDDGDPIIEKYKEFGITDIQYNALILMHKKLREFTDKFGVYYPHKSTEKLINLPEWQEICELAKKTLQVFYFNNK